MAVMAATTDQHGIVPDRPFTVYDLAEMPDDGRRYELLDGMLLVSPAPGLKHQEVILCLGVLLKGSCPAALQVILAPFAVRPCVTTELQPDVLVARKQDLTEKHLPAAPLLAVEVLSSSSVLYDTASKKAAYERFGVRSYWVIDPPVPQLTAFELDTAGQYQQVARVRGSEVFDAERPFPVRVVPAELLEPREN
jgi:Uma2 family endonuclease